MKSYKDVLNILKSSTRPLYVCVHFSNENYDWLPVDVGSYINRLEMMSNAHEVPFPGYFEVEPDGEMFIHTTK